MRNRWWAAPVLAGAAAVITACGSSSPSTTTPNAPASTSNTPASSSSNPSGTATVSTRSTSIGTVLVNAQGHTLYWFAIDTPTKSNCNGACASYWPPVIGKAMAASGTTLPMGFGTITRSNGSTQATYDGHPLYTYAADTSAGMTSGNDKNLSGGLWWAMTPTGAKPASGGGASTSASTGGGGY
jgi:predicted lipoprotein with Yx(FWY)xxD motif